VPFARAPEAVVALMQVASERGITRAKLTLKPAELGGIEIRLRASADGVRAHLVADSPQAAALLQSAGDDLRRSLAGRDVTLLALEISTAAPQAGTAGDGSAAHDGNAASGGTGQPGTGSTGSGTTSTATSGDPDSQLPTVIELSDGLLVDVLA
jgi:flagellar hook-length control protein FliK